MAKTNITVSILGDASNLQRALGQADSKLATFGAKAERVGKSMTMYVSMPLAAGGAAAIKWAGDLEDSGALAAEVFKGNARDILAWSKTTAKTFGISQKDAVEYADQFGLALQNIGKMSTSESAKVSKSLVGLSADLGSAFGTSSREAFDALRAALTGEYEQLKKYGIVINETALKQEYLALTGEKVTGVLNAQQKQQATLSLITKQTSVVQGDFARNADGTTNAMKTAVASAQDLATGLGTTLLPAFNGVMRVGQRALDMFKGLPQPVQSFAAYAGVAAVAAGPLLTVFGKLAQSRVVGWMGSLATNTLHAHGAIRDIAASRGVSYFEALGGVTRESTRNMGRLGQVVTMAGKALGGAGLAFAAYEAARAIGNATENSKQLEAAINRMGASDNPRDLAKQLQEAADSVEGLDDKAMDLFAPGGEAVVNINGFRVELDNLDEALDAIGDTDPDGYRRIVAAFRDGKFEIEQASDSSLAFGDAVEQTDNVLRSHIDVLKSEEEANKSGAKATDDATAAADENAAATEEQTSALQQYVDTLSGSLDPVFAYSDAVTDLADAKRDVTEAQRKVAYIEAIGARGTAEHREAVRTLEEAQRRQVRSAADLESATGRLAEDVRAGTTDWATATAALDRWTAEGKITAGQAAATKREIFLAAVAAAGLDRQHPTVTVGAETRGFWQNAINVERWKPQPKYVPIHVDFMGNARGGILGIGGIGRRQYGGPVVKGRPYLVGEVGPEIVVPAFNGHVIPNHAIGPPPASSPPPTVQMELHFHGPVAGQDGARWVAEQIEQAVTAGFPMRRLRQSVAR